MKAFVFLSLLACTSLQQTSASCRNETDLGTWRTASGDCCWVTNMLVISSSVRVLNRIHCRTTHLWPAIPLHSVLVEIVSCFQDWFVHSPTTRCDANNCTASRRNSLPLARWETKTSPATIIRMANNHAS